MFISKFPFISPILPPAWHPCLASMKLTAEWLLEKVKSESWLEAFACGGGLKAVYDTGHVINQARCIAPEVRAVAGRVLHMEMAGICTPSFS